MSVSIWQVLRIAPTEEVAVIRKAYATRLKEIKRDLDPHAFQQLRWAYEAALSRSGGSNAPFPSPAGLPSAESPAVETPSVQDPQAQEAQPRSDYSAALPVQRMVITSEEPPPRRQRWKDVVGPPGEAPPPAKRRRRDVEAPPGSGPDERQRVENALAAVREAMGAGARTPADAVATFNDAYESLSHPVTGVSIAALAAFERELVNMFTTRVAEGETVAAVAREASKKFAWLERMRDVHAGSDPLAQSLAGFLAAEEIARCARGGTDGPVDRAFASDLVSPVKPASFAWAIMTRAALAKRRAQFETLAAMPAGPLAWLPPATVEWWKGALSRPRLHPFSIIVLMSALIAPAASILAAYLHSPVPRAIGLPGMLGMAVAVLSLAMYQDVPALRFLQPLWRMGNAARRALERSWTVLGVTLPLRVYFIYPLLGALSFAGLIAVNGRSAQEVARDVMVFVGIVCGGAAAMAIYQVSASGLSLVWHRFSEWTMRKQQGISTTRKVVILVAAVVACVGGLAGIAVFEGDQDVLAKILEAVGALAWLAAIAAAAYALWRLVGRLSSRRQPWVGKFLGDRFPVLRRRHVLLGAGVRAGFVGVAIFLIHYLARDQDIESSLGRGVFWGVITFVVVVARNR